MYNDRGRGDCRSVCRSQQASSTSWPRSNSWNAIDERTADDGPALGRTYVSSSSLLERTTIANNVISVVSALDFRQTRVRALRSVSAAIPTTMTKTAVSIISAYKRR